jgi:8-oxo-dGTP pyrophosphatase MutT (NUDIX family)
MSTHGVIIKMLQRYWRFARGLTMGAQAVVIDESGRILLVRHSYRPGWFFPGGGVEKGETVVDALRRELAEETGIVPTAPPQLFGLYANFDAFPGDHIALFVVREWRQGEAPKRNREIVEQGFFAPDALPDTVSAGTRRRLAEVLAGGATSAIW